MKYIVQILRTFDAFMVRVRHKVLWSAVQLRLRRMFCVELGGPTVQFRSGPLRMRGYESRVLVSNGPNAEAFDAAFCNGAREARCSMTIDATSLKGLNRSAISQSVCIISSHLIEHLADPIGAVQRWGDHMRNGDAVLLVAPDYRPWFDWNRGVTPFSHLEEDFRLGQAESDRSHVDDVLSNSDWSRGGNPELENLLSKGSHSGIIHHHTFDLTTLVRLVRRAGLTVIFEWSYKGQLIVMAEKE